MSDSNHDSDHDDLDQNRNPSMSRSLLGRIVGVLLFIGLGTFAVVQMMSGDAKKNQQANLPGADSSIVAPEASKTEKPITVSSNTLAPISPVKNATFNSASILNTKTPPSSPPAKSATAANTPSNGFANRPQSNTFGTPAVVKTAKPPTNPATKPTPPARYAQLPDNGVPIITSNGGFGSRPKAPAIVTGAVQKSANNVTNQAKEFGASFGNKTGTLLTDAKAKAANTFGNAADQLKSSVPSLKTDSGFNPKMPLAPRSFTPPNIQTNVSPVSSNPALTAPQPKTNFNPSASMSSLNQNGFGAPKKTALPARQSILEAAEPSRQNLSPAQPAKSPVQPLNTGNGFGSTQTPISRPSNINSQFGSQSKTASPPLSRIQQPNQIQPRSQIPTIPASNSRPSTSASRPTSRLGLPATGGALASVAANPKTLNIPGDRDLEGVQAPALTVEKLSPREIQVNEPAEFEIVVRNVGRVPAENVVVYDQIPAGTDFQGASPEPSSLTPDRKINWEIGNLRAGQEKRIKMQLKPTQPGEIGSVAHVTFSTQASMRTLVTKPVLSITHRTNPKVLIGDDVVFDVIVENKGDGPAKNVVIQEDVPKQLEYQEGYRELEYDIGTLQPGQSKRIQLGLKAAEIGQLRNIVFVSASGGLQAKHELDMEVIAPRLLAESNGPTRRFLQREVSHQFTVSNKGTAPATNVDLVARLPAGLRYIKANNQGRYDSNSHAVYWSLAELGLGVDASVEVTTNPVEAGAQDIKFEAMADLNQKADAVQPLAVEHLVDVFFDIDDVVDPIEIGSDTSYRIRVVNQGTKSAANVRLKIDFPPGLLPSSVEGNLQNEIQGQRIDFAPITSLNPGEQLQFLVHAKGQAAGDHRVIVNMQADGRQTPVSKEETTRVYADR